MPRPPSQRRPPPSAAPAVDAARITALTGLTPESLAARVLHRDAHALVIDKPAGLAVHQGPRTEASLELALPWLAFGLPRPPGLAHRLDRDTSGCLVLGRHPSALRKLNALFAAGAVEKTYWAVVVGGPGAEAGRIDQPLLKVNRRTGWSIVADPAGQSAVTDYRVLGRGGGLAWLELKPHTGRTHQIRVHCAGLGCPILGDPTYGNAADRVPMHLHARAIRVPYPERPIIAVDAPAPEHMLSALRACEAGTT